MKQSIFTHANTRQAYMLSALILLFLLLTYAVLKFPPSSIDLEVSNAIQKRTNGYKDHFMVFISWFGHTPISIFMVVLVAATFYYFKYRREAIFTVLTLTSGIVSTAIKILVNRPRPTAKFVRILEIAKQQSFPSGHTLFYTFFFGFMILLMVHLKSINRRVRVVVITLSGWMIVLIPYSRIYLGAHWASDVCGGLIMGVICLMVLNYFYKSGALAKGSS